MSGRPLVRRILLADGNANDRDLALEMLVSGIEAVMVETADGTEELAERLHADSYDLVVADRALAARAMRLLEDGGARCPVIVFAAPDTGFGVREILGKGAYCVLTKDSAGFLQLPALARRAMESGISAAVPESALVERLPVGVFSIGSDGRIRSANRSATESLGFGDPNETIGMPLIDRLDSHPAQRRLQALLDGRESALDIEAALRRPDGRSWWVRMRLWPSSGEEGVFEGTLEDISEYKETEAELGRQAAELGRSNADLEQFAYVVSHDLQEPLALIQRYAELLAEEKIADKNKQASGYLEQVLDSSQRMQSMIDAILEYSRIETRGTPFRSVDIEEVVAEAVANLSAAMEESGAEVRYRDLPTVNADRGQMLQLFQNLIGNAVKFRTPRRKPRIRITASEQAAHWRFTVQDNGIGVDPDQRERIFGMFQRLHTGSEYPGTGIGLAICRGIVRRHGGDIWVDSVPGEGSTFHFTIAKAL